MSYEAWGDNDEGRFDAAIEAGWIDPVDQTKALIDVMNERNRQVNEEDFDHHNDDTYICGELADAAACYALCARGDAADKAQLPHEWPWDSDWWKPTTTRRDLVKAGALILAEIERLDRTGVAP